MKGEKLAYTVKVLYNADPGMHPWTVVVTSVRYKDDNEFSGRAIKSLMAKAAQWIEEH